MSLRRPGICRVFVFRSSLFVAPGVSSSDAQLFYSIFTQTLLRQSQFPIPHHTQGPPVLVLRHLQSHCYSLSGMPLLILLSDIFYRTSVSILTLTLPLANPIVNHLKGEDVLLGK
jgi:hypothetical protein